MKSQDFTKKACKGSGHLPDFIKQNYHKRWGPNGTRKSQLPYFNAQKWLKNIPTLQAFQAFQVTSQEPKLRYNQLDTPAMTKRKRCHSVVFIVRLGPSAPFTNHKSSRKYHVFFDMFFSWNNSTNVMEGWLPSNLNIRTCWLRIIPKCRKYQEGFFLFCPEAGEGVGGPIQGKDWFYINFIYQYIYIYRDMVIFCSSSRNQHLESCNQKPVTNLQAVLWAATLEKLIPRKGRRFFQQGKW